MTKPDQLDDLTKDKLTINIVKANLYGLVLAIPVIIVFAVPYYLIWNGFETEIFAGYIILIAVIPGIILHELIHGLTWARYADEGFSSIKFGIIWKFITPYCHCKEPMSVRHYILGAAMPGIVLGFIPALLALVFGIAPLLWLGIFFTIAAIGDFMMINLLKDEDSDALVQDHPSEAGCYIYRNQETDGR